MLDCGLKSSLLSSQRIQENMGSIVCIFFGARKKQRAAGQRGNLQEEPQTLLISRCTVPLGHLPRNVSLIDNKLGNLQPRDGKEGLK